MPLCAVYDSHLIQQFTLFNKGLKTAPHSLVLWLCNKRYVCGGVGTNDKKENLPKMKLSFELN